MEKKRKKRRKKREDEEKEEYEGKKTLERALLFHDRYSKKKSRFPVKGRVMDAKNMRSEKK